MCLIFCVLIVPMELHVTLPENGYVSELGESGVISNTAINYGKTKQEGDCVTFYSIPLGSKSNKLTEKNLLLFYILYNIFSRGPLAWDVEEYQQEEYIYYSCENCKKKTFQQN